MTWAAVAAALASAFCYAVASVTQFREAGEVKTEEVGSPTLLLKLVVRPWWLAGAVADVFGVLLQAVALAWGSVVLVQPLLVTGVAMAVVLAAAVERQWPHPRELQLAIGVSIALGVLVVMLDTYGGRQHFSLMEFLPYGIGVVVLAGASILLARLWPSAAPGWLGCAAGVMVGCSSVLLKVCTGQLSDNGWGVMLTHWQLYGFLAFGGAALLLSQNAFQAGRMAPGIASLSLVEPLVAIAIAVPLLHEHLTITPLRVVVDVIAAAVAVYCVVGLANATEQRAHELAGEAGTSHA